MSVLVLDQEPEGIVVQIRGVEGTLSSVVAEKDKLLAVIDELLQENNTALKEIKSIVVRLQQGRFSATRIAIVTANAIAYAVGAKVHTMMPGEQPEIALDREADRYALAQYSAPPSISKPKV